MKRPRQPRHGAFTLVEIVVTLFIVMLILGMSALTIRSVSSERYLREVTSEIRDFAKKARAQALMEQRAFQIEFQPAFFRVQGLQIVQEDTPFDSQLYVYDGGATKAQELKRYNLPEDMTIEISRWPGTEWTPAAGHAWVFEQSGICEPVSLRVTSPKGYIEMHFNALTAGVEEEAYEIY